MTTVINKGKIGEQDIYRFDGSGTNTFTRDTSTGATLTLNKVGYEVNALVEYGGGTVLTDVTISDALTALGAVTPCTLLITPGAWTISNDLTITSNIVLKVAAGATLEVAAGKTLTIEGPIDAPSLEIFTGSGTTTITTTIFTQGIWTGGGGVIPRITTITSSATPTINTDNCDAVTITALAAAITSMTSGLSGTPVNFQKLIIRIKDDGTARAISWGASFEAKGVSLPTTTVISKVLTVGFIYDTVTSKWGCVAAAQEV
jgi:hypothetical protein